MIKPESILGLANKQIKSLKELVYNESPLTEWEHGMLTSAGTSEPSTSRVYSPSFIKVKKGDYISLEDYVSYQYIVCRYSTPNTGDFIERTGWLRATYEVPEDGYVRIAIGTRDSSNISDPKEVGALSNFRTSLTSNVSIDDLSPQFKSMFYGQPTLSWVVGMISTSAGTEYASTNRMRNTDFVWIEKETTVELTDYTDYRLAVYLYDENNNYLGWSSWIDKNNYVIPANRYVRFLMSRIDNVDLTPDDVKTGSALISFQTYLTEFITTDMYKNGSITPDKFVEGMVISKWNGKKANFLGDSITAGAEKIDGVWTTVTPFHEHLKNMLGLSVARNYGIASTAISTQSDYDTHDNAFVNRYQSMDNDADLIVVFGGTNDFGHNVPLGTIADKTDVSFYGALNVLITGLIEKYQGKRLVFMTPLHRDRAGDNNETNAIGVKLSEYVQAIKEVCGYYSVPVIDTYNISGITPFVQSIYDTYINDGLHPTEAGHELLAKNIVGQFETI